MRRAAPAPAPRLERPSKRAAPTRHLTRRLASRRRYAVTWQLDSEAAECAVCSSQFNFLLRRRHHCRSCGKCVCDSCSTTRRPVPGTSNLKRVCDRCVGSDLDGARRGDGDAWPTSEGEGGTDGGWSGSDRGHWRTTMD